MTKPHKHNELHKSHKYAPKNKYEDNREGQTHYYKHKKYIDERTPTSKPEQNHVELENPLVFVLDPQTRTFYEKNLRLKPYLEIVTFLELPKIHKDFKPYVWNCSKTLHQIENVFNHLDTTHKKLIGNRKLTFIQDLSVLIVTMHFFYNKFATSRKQAESVS